MKPWSPDPPSFPPHPHVLIYNDIWILAEIEICEQTLILYLVLGLDFQPPPVHLNISKAVGSEIYFRHLKGLGHAIEFKSLDTNEQFK
jgi:hypothetical protein